MTKRVLSIAAAITICLVIAIFAGSGEREAGAKEQDVRLATAAAIPEMLNYQGVLTDDVGTPLDTTVSMILTIYDASVDGNVLWTETHAAITTLNGLYNVLLGSVTPIPAAVFEEQNCWLGVAVGDDPEMTPRQRIASSAYAYWADYAEEAGEADAVDWSKITDIPAGFADGVDDGGGGGISQINAGAGVTVTDPTGPTATVAADFGPSADQVAAGNHSHNAEYVNEGQANSITNGMIVDGTITGSDLEQPFSLSGSSDLPFLSVTNNGTGVGVRVSCNYGVGVDVTSSGYDGNSVGVAGTGGSIGVTGHSNMGIGVYATSNNGKGVYGMSTSGWAGHFGGQENNGTMATFKISSGSQDMIFDSNEIDVLNGGLHLNHNSGNNVAICCTGGNVGIGTDGPSYKLHVVGDIAYTGNIYDVSDRRLKENVTPLDGAVNKVASIRGIYFNNKGETPYRREVGVIAQEVEKVLPEVVSEDAEGYKSVDYSKLTPLLIEAVKEQQTQIEALKAEIVDLKARVR